MNTKTTKEDCIAEIKRFFKYYYFFCESSDTDSIRELLSSTYSINDKLRKADLPNFFKNNFFLTIKAIRNYNIHHAEIYNKTKAIPLVSNSIVQADLNILCLLPIEIINKINESITTTKNKIDFKETCIYYKKYVDIYPCIFNFAVDLFFYTEENNLDVYSDDYKEFKKSIEYEKKNNFPHYVKGGFILLNKEDKDLFIDEYLHSIDMHLELRNKFYDENDGIFTLKNIT